VSAPGGIAGQLLDFINRMRAFHFRPRRSRRASTSVTNIQSIAIIMWMLAAGSALIFVMTHVSNSRSVNVALRDQQGRTSTVVVSCASTFASVAAPGSALRDAVAGRSTL
jgi:hypothetical protein